MLDYAATPPTTTLAPTRSHALPPGPRESSLRQALRFGSAPLDYFTALAAEHGDTFTLRLPGDPPRVVCSHPDDIQRVLALPAAAYTSKELAMPLNLGRHSLLFLDGDEHLADRKLMVPALHGERVTSHVDTIAAVTRACMASWPTTPTLSLQAELHRITLEVILRCMFGLSRGPAIERCAELTTRWLAAMLSPTLFTASVLLNPARVRRFFDAQVARSPARTQANPRLRVWPWQRIADRKAEIMAILQGELERARTDAPGRNDVLASLVAARRDDGSAMSDAQLVDELLTLLVGGHETTATALAWLFVDLLGHHEVLARVREELRAACPSGRVDADALRRLPYLDACIKESLRLHPIAPAISRQLVEPLALRRCEVPSGALVWPSLYLAHTRADTWPEPLAFRPERFASGRPSPTHFLPFGGGRRRCIGMTFAGLEMLVVTAEILLAVDLERVHAAPPRALFRGITIVPADGVPVRVSSRRDTLADV